MSEEIIIEQVDSNEEIMDCTVCGNPAHCGYEITYFRVTEEGLFSEEQHVCGTCQCENCLSGS